jgi:hypothetical protein
MLDARDQSGVLIHFDRVGAATEGACGFENLSVIGAISIHFADDFPMLKQK